VQQERAFDVMGCALYLMCDDIEKEIDRLRESKVICSAPDTEDCGVSTTVTLPGGGRIGLYQPRHATAV
jgi:hypothetical protein